MDEPYAVDATNGGSLTADLKLQVKSESSSSPFRIPINEGIKRAKKIAKISVITLLSLGIVELLIGQISGSVVATADGIDSLSDTMISFIVFIGLVIADRPEDGKFHFGYYKVESFAALIAAIGMIIIGSIILYESAYSLLEQQHTHQIHQPILTMVVLAAASVISLSRAIQMRNIANRYNLLSLRTDAKNSIKDGSASVIAFMSVLFATQFGFLQMDAIGGIVIAGYIFSVAYISVKQSSLILVDSWQNPKVTEMVRQTVEEEIGEFKNKRQIKVRSILLRPAGMMVVFAAVHIEVDGNKRLADVEVLTREVEMAIRSKMPYMKKISVIPHSLP
jgi:cation diffusion facilitator family transporter